MTEIDIGLCEEHERPYEGMCKQCESVICPSCVMFGNHKKHDIVSLKEGSLYLRREIDKTIFKGQLKKEFSESKVLEVHERNLLLEKTKADTVKKLEMIFKEIINTLKQRKCNLINEIIDKFNVEKEKIDNAECDWMYKQDICEKLNMFFNEQNHSFLLINSKFIMEGLRKLEEPIQFTELSIYNALNTDFVLEGKHDQDGKVIETKTYSLDELIDAFNQFISIGKPNLINYKA